VTKLVPFGAFVRVAQGIEGLVHISELSHEHIDAPESVLSVGDEVQVKVVDVDVSRRRVSLSMRQVTAAPAKPPTEIEVEPEPERGSSEPLVPTVQVPQEVLDAIAESETGEPVQATRTGAGPVDEADVGTMEPAAAMDASDVATAEPDAARAEPEVPAEQEVPAEGSPEAPATDEEVSLEAILEDLKRREGRSE